MMDANFENDWRRKQEIVMRPYADNLYHLYFGKCKISRDDKTLDKEFGIDVILTLTNGMRLLGQEKFLSYEDHKKHKWQNVTVEYYQDWKTKEEGDWFKLCCQFYFVGHCNKDKTGFDSYVILNWINVVISTDLGKITWREHSNTRNGARASLRAVDFNLIPGTCIMASAGFEEMRD